LEEKKILKEKETEEIQKMKNNEKPNPRDKRRN